MCELLAAMWTKLNSRFRGYTNTNPCHAIVDSFEITSNVTFSETLLLLPFSNSGAIQGRVPRTPPVTKVFRLIFDKPKSPTWERKFVLINMKNKLWFINYIENCNTLNTLHIGRRGSFKFTSKLSHFKSKCTMFFECKYSIPKAASIAIINLLRRSRCLKKHVYILKPDSSKYWHDFISLEHSCWHKSSKLS